MWCLGFSMGVFLLNIRIPGSPGSSRWEGSEGGSLCAQVGGTSAASLWRGEEGVETGNLRLEIL